MRIAMAAPVERPCGIGDYTDRLISAMELQGVEVVRFASEDTVPKDVELVHVQHQYFLYGGVAPWKNRFGAWLERCAVPVVMTVHEVVDEAPTILHRTALRVTNRSQFLSHKLSSIFVHTELDRNRLIKLGVDPKSVNVVRMGVPEIANVPPRDEARSQLEVPPHTPIGVLFGFLSRKKGHMVALEALRKLPPDYQLVFAGAQHPDDHTDYVSSLHEFVRTHGLSSRIQFSGYLALETAHAWLSAADVVLAPFLESSGSASLAEAFACGSAVLASDIEVNQEISRLVPNCIQLHRSSDPNDLAKQWRTVSEDAELQRQLRGQALKFAHTMTFENMAHETIAQYRSVLGSPR